MANFAFTVASQKGNTGDLNHAEAGGMDIRVLLVMSNTTAAADFGAQTLSGITTLDECDGASYARQLCNNQVATQDLANRRSEFSHDVVTFANLGAGSRQTSTRANRDISEP